MVFGSIQWEKEWIALRGGARTAMPERMLARNPRNSKWIALRDGARAQQA
jgi:hypothetical protein